MERISIYPLLSKYVTKEGFSALSIQIMLDGSFATSINTGIKISSKHWDEDKRSVLRSEPNSQIYNHRLQSEITKLKEKFHRFMSLGNTITKNKVIKIAQGKDLGQDFYKFCDEWISVKHTNKETIRTYKSEVSKAKDFDKECSFGDIDVVWLTKYRTWMEVKRTNSHNTIVKTFKFMKTMMIDAMKQGLIDKDPFENFDRGTYENPAKLGLESFHCDLIEAVSLNVNHPEIVRDIATRFLLMCYSGLRFNDAIAFDPVKHVINGERIVIKTQKADTVLNLKLYSRLAAVVARLVEVKMTNQEFNRHLKVVANLAGIGHIKLTCHVGRHTFGSMLAEMDIPQEQAQRLLAHRDIRSTRIYYHLKQKNIDQAADKLNNF